MTSGQQSVSSTEHNPFRTRSARSSLSSGLVAGLALLALGVALFGLGIFHGFQNGSCSTTGYAGNYGPVQHCGKGVGWWMLMLFVGLFAAGAGATLSGRARTLGIPALFVAIGVPFVALALRSGNTQLLLNASPSTGKISAGIFGACFVIAGVVWGAIATRGSGSSSSGGSWFGGILASVVGVGVAFAIAAGVNGAIGTAAPTTLPQASQGISQSSGSSAPSSAASSAPASAASSAAVRHANAAIKRAQTQAAKLEKLSACVSAAGADTAKIEKCTARYTP